MFPGRAEIPFVALGMVFGFEFSLLVEDTGADDCRLEAIRLRDRPFTHFAAIGPATNAEPRRIGAAFRDYRVEYRHQVFVITSAPISPVGFEKIFAITIGAARIDHQHLIAVQGKQFGPGRLPAIALRKTGRWAAMNPQDERPFAVLRRRGLHEGRFNFRAVEASRFKDRRAGEFDSVPALLQMGELTDDAALAAQPDFRKVLKIFADIGDVASVRHIERRDRKWQVDPRRRAALRDAPKLIAETVNEP